MKEKLKNDYFRRGMLRQIKNIIETSEKLEKELKGKVYESGSEEQNNKAALEFVKEEKYETMGDTTWSEKLMKTVLQET